MKAKFKARSYGLRWHMVVGGRVASSVRSRREYVIMKIRLGGSCYFAYRLDARRSPLHLFEEVATFDHLFEAQDAADRCEWARWEA